jgi:Leucine-rich repeat (LRR) protein
MMGFEQMVNVEEIYVAYNRITELVHLNNLKKLRILDLHNNLLRDLKQLMYLKKSQQLALVSFKANPLSSQ